MNRMESEESCQKNFSIKIGKRDEKIASKLFVSRTSLLHYLTPP